MSSMRVLVVEEQRWISSQLAPLLQGHGYNADFAHSHKEAERLASEGDHEAIVLNIAILARGAESLLANVRQKGLLLFAVDDGSSSTAWPQNVRPDYVIARPIQPGDLITALRLVGREGRASRRATLRLGTLELDMARHEARRGDRRIALTALEYKLLVLLLENEGRVLTRTLLAEQVWGMNSASFSNMVNVAVLRLRRKVDAPGEPKLIHTIRGSGYSVDAT